MQQFEFSSTPDYTIPLPETEIVLIRHGWPNREKDVHPDEWVLDYTAYLELARYLDHSQIQGIERIYTSPQIKAGQTASFYFTQLPKCTDLRKIPGLVEAGRSQQYYENYEEVVNAYLTGQGTDPEWEVLALLEKRVLGTVKALATEARQEHKQRIAFVGHGLFFAVLKQLVCKFPQEETLAHWKEIPFGPYARLCVNASGDIHWLEEITLESEEF